MLRIGLTGGIGSGKTTVTHYFSDLGVPIIDADKIAHEITAPNQSAFKKIIAHFGKSVITKNNSLNRSKLKELIFSNPDDRRWLENLLHPIIITKMETQIKKIKAPYCILVIPLLTEISHSLNFLDRVLVVDVPEILQIERAKARDHLTDQQVKSILKSQSTRQQRLAMADDVIVNDQTLSALRETVSQLHDKYLKLAEKSSGPKD